MHNQLIKIVIVFVLSLILFISLETLMDSKTGKKFHLPAEISISITREGDSIIKSDIHFISQKSDPIELTIQEMSLSEKLGQLVMVGLNGQAVDDQVETFIKENNVGGVILMASNINNIEQTSKLINDLKELNTNGVAPLLFGIDEEGKNITRLPKELIPTPTSRQIGTSNDPEKAYDIGEAIAQKLSTLGFNINFAPVLDIDSNLENPIIGDRSFGSTPDLVSDFGIEQMKGMQQQNMISVIKHFPGHGDTSVDSHVELPIINHDQTRLRSFEMQPFEKAIQHGADVIMTGHLLVPAYDPQYPASMSESIITELLREELGFEGVVVTDDLSMDAIKVNYEIGEAAVQSIRAGSDLLIIANPDHALISVDALEAAVQSGELSESLIDQSVSRLLNLKEKYDVSDDLIEAVDIDEINRFTEKQLNN